MHCNALKVLKERGFVEWSSHNEELEEHFINNMVTGYIGFDPSADSLHVGNLVAIMGLAWLQKLGHRPIAIAGGGTGRIGDPSGKSAERNLLSEEKIQHNVNCIAAQLKHFLNFDCGENSATLVNNNDWLKNEKFIEFLRDTGKFFTVSFLVNREYVRSRVLDPDKSITYTELSYILLQAFDFNHLYNEYGCTLQMGGNDQQVNIIAGMDLTRKKSSGQCYGITFPLLLNSQGQKFGKSESGAVWLDPNQTSPYKFYQFWLNADDADLPKYLRYFTLKSKEEVENLEQTYTNDPRGLKAILAEELTRRVHSDDDFKAVSQVSQLLFGNQAGPDTLLEMGINELHTIAEEIPCKAISASDISQGINIVDLLTVTTILPSKTEARKAIQGNAISINKVKVTQVEHMVTSADLLHNLYFMIENGKKNKFLIKIQD